MVRLPRYVGGDGVTVSTGAKGAHSRPWVPMDAHVTTRKSLLCVQRGSVDAHREGPLPTSPHRAGTHKQSETQAGAQRGRPPLTHHGWQAVEQRRFRRRHGRPEQGAHEKQAGKDKTDKPAGVDRMLWVCRLEPVQLQCRLQQPATVEVATLCEAARALVFGEGEGLDMQTSRVPMGVGWWRSVECSV